jgi:hypothetical protein
MFVRPSHGFRECTDQSICTGIHKKDKIEAKWGMANKRDGTSQVDERPCKPNRK